MKEEAVIKVENVYKEFILPHERTGSVKGMFTSMFSKATRVKEKQHALQGISFDVRKGEFFGIVGRNGSGKSTMLKILANIYQPTNGTVKVEGRLVPFIELGVGFNPELSGRDNVYLNGAMLGFTVKEVDKMYDDIVSFAELERFMDQKLKNYSSGMQVRLAFSAAIKAQADILLVDEVLAVGDADFQNKCFDYFYSLKDKKTTIIFVTHDMNSIRQYCDRAILIDKGKITSSGTASDVASDYSKLFIDADIGKTATFQEGESNRWGDKKMEITKVDVPTKLRSGEPLKIKYYVQANQNIDGPIFGFSVKDASKQVILGTNTSILGHVIHTLKRGDKICLEWTIPNVFSNGKYFVDAAAVYGGGSSVSDWWEEAARFSSQKEQSTFYKVSPDINVISSMS